MNTIVSLAHGLDIMRCFAPSDASLRVSEIAARTGLPRQTVQRLAYTLSVLGCLESRTETGHYRLGPRLLGAGRTLLAHLPLRDIARPIMQRLADANHTSVALGAPHELEMLYLEYCVSPRTVTFLLRIGSAIPVATTAMGRAWLWALGTRRRSMLLARIKRDAGRQGEALASAIQQSFRELDRDGFCTTFPSSRTDICGVGAPLVFNNGDTVLAMNCGSARLGLNERRFRSECGPALREAVAEIKNAVGQVNADYLGIADSLQRA
jgi:IclR family transcriptional regulator, positive regulator for flagellar biogenesis